MDSKNRYLAINGLKGISILLIVLMHVGVNGNYKIDGFVFNNIVKNLSVFIELFFIVSGFGMCCGYYEKIKNNELNINDFYKKRYSKIIPFFSIIVIAEIIFSGISKKTLLDGLLDMTLLFGFLPNSNIDIVGVGWTLGVIFAFYCIFPFFVFLIWNKKRAWITLVISLVIQYCCVEYFKADGAVVMSNIATWFSYFVIGGLIFLYKDDIKEKLHKCSYLVAFIVVLLFIAEVILYNHLGSGTIPSKIIILMFVAMVIYAISTEKSMLCSKVSQIIGNNCMEIYLAHMMMFRAVQKLGLTNIFGNEEISYIFTFVLVVLLTMAFSVIFKIVTRNISEVWNRKKTIK